MTGNRTVQNRHRPWQLHQHPSPPAGQRTALISHRPAHGGGTRLSLPNGMKAELMLPGLGHGSRLFAEWPPSFLALAHRFPQLLVQPCDLCWPKDNSKCVRSRNLQRCLHLGLALSSLSSLGTLLHHVDKPRLALSKLRSWGERPSPAYPDQPPGKSTISCKTRNAYCFKPLSSG